MGMAPVPAPFVPGEAQPPGSRWSCATFADIDEQAAALQGWNQEYLQLSPGVFCGVVQRLQLDGVGLFVEDLQQVVHQTGHVRPDVVALGVPVLLQGDTRFCGQAGNASALHVFSGRDGFEFRSPRRHVMLGIEVDVPLFESQVIDGARGGAAAFAGRAHLHCGDPASFEALRRFLVDLFTRGGQEPSLLQADMRRLHVRDELLDRLSAAVRPAAGHADTASCGLAVPGAQTTLADRARQLVAARLDEPPTVADLCALLGVSRRTLQSCFHATWGMGPLAWLNTLRLNAVRRRLKTARSVTEAATQFGFWHFGHFATDYRALFGETPSQTLRRRGTPT